MPNTISSGLFTSCGILVCAVMILVNLAQIKSKGNGALIRAAAFAWFAGLLWEFKVLAPTFVEIATGLLIFCLLAADVFLKANKTHGAAK